eukprot:Selendium_serpulae@DN7944_c0_g1_i1.p1
MTSDAREAIGAMRGTNLTVLSILNLSENQLGNEGAKINAQSLPKNKMLKSLKMSRNNIGDERALAIGEALLNNLHLTSLTTTSRKKPFEWSVKNCELSRP